VLDQDAPVLVRLEAVDAADQCRFAGAGRAADDDLLALFDRQIDVLENVEGAIPLVDADQLHSWHANLRTLGLYRFGTSEMLRMPIVGRWCNLVVLRGCNGRPVSPLG